MPSCLVSFNPTNPMFFGLIAFVLTIAIMPLYINWLKKQQIGQFVRTEGPQSHASKAHTPTMGGVCFIITTLICVLGWLSIMQKFDLSAAVVLAVALLCGLLGLADDLAKVHHKTNEGISARIRLLAELAIGLGAAFALLALDKNHLAIEIPFFYSLPSISSTSIDSTMLTLKPIWCICIGPFVVAATTNAFNLHDGMDGLAAGTSTLVFITMGIMFGMLGYFNLAAIAFIAAGSVAGFLGFNRRPAAIFMGDTGSLFIGGLLAALTLASGTLFWFAMLSLIYIAETLSVMIQVVWFKLTKPYKPDKPMSAIAIIWTKLTKRLPGEGKRLFRMAPLHHHFEAVFFEKGVTEGQIVASFWFVQAFICLCVLASFCLMFHSL